MPNALSPSFSLISSARRTSRAHSFASSVLAAAQKLSEPIALWPNIVSTCWARSIGLEGKRPSGNDGTTPSFRFILRQCTFADDARRTSPNEYKDCYCLLENGNQNLL